MARISRWLFSTWIAALPIACGGHEQPPPATAIAPPAPAAPTAPACSDQSGPGCWLHQLESPTTTASAVAHFEAALDRASQQPDHGKSLVDQIVDPLTHTYVDHYSDLDVETRVKLIRLLSELGDKRTGPALAKAFDEYARHPPTDPHENDIAWAATAEANLRLATVADSLLRAFLAFQAHTAVGRLSFRPMNAAMTAAPEKSWTGPLVKLLATKVVRPTRRSEVGAYLDQLFWQTTAAEVLGDLRAPEAIKPLLREMLDPLKADMQATSVLALVKIGKPAEEAAVGLLRGKDTGLVDFAKQRIAAASHKVRTAATGPGKPWVRAAAVVLGTIGRPEAAGPMIEVLGHTSNAVDKAIIARELTKLPASKKTERAFEHAYESIGVDVVVPTTASSALQALTQAAVSFRDPGMVPWLLGRASKTKGNQADLAGLRGTILITSIKLAKAGQIRSVKRGVDAYGTKIEKDAYALGSKVLETCGDRVACYLDAVVKPESQKQATQFTGIKAATMVGALGDEHSAEALVDRLDAIHNVAVRYTVAMSIDHLLPRGSTAVADKLDAIVARNAKSGDRERIMGDAPLKQVSYRIRTRAR